MRGGEREECGALRWCRPAECARAGPVSPPPLAFTTAAWHACRLFSLAFRLRAARLRPCQHGAKVCWPTHKHCVGPRGNLSDANDEGPHGDVKHRTWRTLQQNQTTHVGMGRRTWRTRRTRMETRMARIPTGAKRRTMWFHRCEASHDVDMFYQASRLLLRDGGSSCRSLWSAEAQLRQKRLTSWHRALQVQEAELRQQYLRLL